METDSLQPIITQLIGSGGAVGLLAAFLWYQNRNAQKREEEREKREEERSDARDKDNRELLAARIQELKENAERAYKVNERSMEVIQNNTHAVAALTRSLERRPCLLTGEESDPFNGKGK